MTSKVDVESVSKAFDDLTQALDEVARALLSVAANAPSLPYVAAGVHDAGEKLQKVGPKVRNAGAILSDVLTAESPD